MRILSLFLFTLIFLSGCQNKNRLGGTIVIGISSDAETLNPLFASGSNAQTLIYFLFPDLVEHEFNSTTGRDSLVPALAKSWTWSDSGKTLTYHLRTDALWSSDKPITAYDIEFSYRVALNPKSGSIRRSKFGLFDPKNPVKAINDSTLVFHFSNSIQRNLAQDQTLSGFISQSAFDSIIPERIKTSEINRIPVTGKYFNLEKWTSKQEIILQRNPKWYAVPQLEKIAFKIIPDAQTRLIEFKSGSLDMIEGISPEEAKSVSSTPNIRIEKQSFRRVEFIGWNALDPKTYKKDKSIRPHKIFFDPNVRRALTLAINRDEILSSWLGNYGQTATGPISPAFRYALNDTIKPLPFSLDQAKLLLAKAGWTDHDGDGVIDKNGIPFEFTLTTNSGNDRRTFVMQKVQNDLKAIGIKVNTQILETNTFNTGLRNHEWEAFVAGWTINMIPDLQAQFGSDLDKNTLNATGYRNAIVDSLLSEAGRAADETAAGEWLKKIQVILNEDQPMTFLYWYDHLIAIRQRLQGVRPDIYSPYHKYWEWYVKE